MKKLLIFIPFILIANILTPPSVPKNKLPQKLPNQCKSIPPIIIFLPPPLEKSLNRCKNILNKPSLKKVKKVFSKKHLKVKSLNIVKDFIEVYEIKTNKGNFLCNKNLTKCFKVIK